MTFTEAAAEVLRLVGRPLHYKEITDLAIEKNLLSHVGKSPEVTMGARLAALLKKSSKDNPLVRVKPGVFALREWDDATIKAGMNEKSAKPTADAVNAAPEEGALEKTPEERSSSPGAAERGRSSRMGRGRRGRNRAGSRRADRAPKWRQPGPRYSTRRTTTIVRSSAVPIRFPLGLPPPKARRVNAGVVAVVAVVRSRTQPEAFSGGGGGFPSYTVTPAFGEGARAPVAEGEPAPVREGREIARSRPRSRP